MGGRRRKQDRQTAEESAEIRRVAERAIRRLDMLEYVLLAATALLSLLGGALAAFLLGGLAGLPFRSTWAVASVLLFVVPAVATWHRNREPRSSSAPGQEPPDRVPDPQDRREPPDSRARDDQRSTPPGGAPHHQKETKGRTPWPTTRS